jgi:hypothetical protein
MANEQTYSRTWASGTGWRVQRIGWGLIGGCLLIAALGGTGPGLLSRSVQQDDAQQLRVEYSSIERCSAPSQLVFRLGLRDHRLVRLVISRDFLDRVQVESFMPSPRSTAIQGDTVQFSFEVAENPVIILRYQHETPGARKARIGLEGESPVVISQLVLP